MQNRIHRQRSLAAQVANVLHDSILSGALRQGERIVVERFAEQLGVSPTPVREAIGRFVQEGLVVEGPGGRLHVARLTRSYVHGTYLVRAALEGLAVEMATARLTELQRGELQDALAACDGTLAREDYARHGSANMSLHGLLTDYAENTVLLREIRALLIHRDFIRAHVINQLGQESRIAVHKEHKHIVELVVSRDPFAARQAMEQHIRSAGERIAQTVDLD